MDPTSLIRRNRLATVKPFSAWRIAALIVLVISPIGARTLAADSVQPPAQGQPGSKVAPFRIAAVNPPKQGADPAGKLVVFPADEVRDQFTVVCFLGAECPLARLYGRRLNALADEFAASSVRFLGVNSNRQDSPEDILNYIAEHEIAFPIGKDYQHQVADQFGAQRTPEVFVVDANLTIRYRGRIDDQYQPGVARAKVGREDLRLALQQLVAGESVSQPVTSATGCLIGRVKSRPKALDSAADVTFAQHVSRVLIKHCVECHRAGEIGPFALTDYDEVAGWADTILETIDDGRMPPWHASSEHGAFANAREMPDEDRQLLRTWVAAGLPFGDPADLPELPPVVAGWQLPREPDLVLEMRPQPFTVPPTGTVDYQYFVVDPGFKTDQWITAAQVVPGSRAVVHHGICFIRPPDGARFRGVGWLTAYVPGQRNVALPPGAARLVPAGSKLVFQMHYTPNGQEQQDLTKIGILLGRDEDVTHEVFTVVAIDQEFEIPPHAANHVVTTSTDRLPPESELFAIIPHMHVRGKSIRVSSTRGKTEQILLDVPRYDFNWQHSYFLDKPVPLSAVDKLTMTAIFDNSAANPTNPDPTQHVTWGDQTWQEMAIAFLEVSQPRDAAQRSTAVVRKPQPVNKAAQIEAFVVSFLQRFDKNRDGFVDREETPLSIRTFGFNQFDDGDGRLTEDEIRKAARNQF